MNRTFKTAVVAPILAAAFAGSVAAGPFEDGLNAVAHEDYATAIRLWGTLADRGDVRAQVALAIIYATGRGVPQDYAAAASWYRKAADQGYVNAQYNLGLMYANGQGIPQDHVSAHMWWNLSAARGDKDAAKNLEMVAAKMTPAQIAEAQRLAREWKPRQK